jgi:hypothetical protein
MHLRALLLGLAVVLAGCRPVPPPEQPIIVEAPLVPVAADEEPDEIHPAIEDDPPAFHYERQSLPPEEEDEYEVWGNVTGTPIGDDYGSSGLGRSPSMGPPPENRTFTSLSEERGALQTELAWTEENIEVLIAAGRRLKRQQQRLEAQTPVDEDALAVVEWKIENNRSTLEFNRKRKAAHEARLDEIEEELRRRRKMIEAGQCPAEPCPPGTALPSGAAAGHRRVDLLGHLR